MGASGEHECGQDKVEREDGERRSHYGACGGARYAFGGRRRVVTFEHGDPGHGDAEHHALDDAVQDVVAQVDRGLHLRPEGPGVDADQLHPHDVAAENPHRRKQRREQRHREHAAPEARRHHARDGTDRHHLHRGELLGGFHQPDLRGDRGAGAAREQQTRHHRTELAHQRQRDQHAERFGGAEALQRLIALQREHHADEQPRHQDDDEREHAGEVDLGDGQPEAPQRRAGMQHEEGEEEAGESQAPDVRGHGGAQALKARAQIRDTHLARRQFEIGVVARRRVVERHRAFGAAVDELAHEGLGARADLVGSALGDDPALRHEINVVDHAERLLHVVRDDDRGGAERVVQLADQAHDDAEGDRIEAGERLVVENQLRIQGNGARQRHAPCHAARELGRREMRCAAQADRVQLHHHQVVQQLVGQRGMLAQRERHVLVHRHVGEQRTELEQHAHLAAHGVQRLDVEILGGVPEHARLSVGGAQRTHDHAQQGRLAATRLSHDADDGAALDGEVDVAQHRTLRVIAEGQLADLHDGLNGPGLLHGVILSRMGEAAVQLEAAVRIDALVKRYGALLALDNVSLSVAPREAFGLVGANGAGKTTLIRCLLDLTACDAGAIRIFGVAARAPASRARLVYLPERFMPPHYLTGREFLRTLAGLAGTDDDEAPAVRMAAEPELERDALAFALGGAYQVYACESRASEIALVRQLDAAPPLALVDLGLPPMPHAPDEGFQLIADLLAHSPGMKIFVLSGQNDAANARHARALGAWEFVAKPSDPALLKRLLARPLEAPAADDADLAGDSPALGKLKSQIAQFAAAPYPVLIEGESGSGKEMAARSLHRLSPRASRPYLTLNCAAIAPTLVEPTLFGYVKGAFTGDRK